jgi:hypothetical protein
MGQQRRALVLAGAGIGALVLVLVLTTVLFGGDDDLAFDDFPTPTPTTATTVPLAPGETPDVETFEIFTTKNPFAPLVDTGVVAPPPTDPTAPGDPTTPPPSPAPDPVTPPTDPRDPPPPSPDPTDPPPGTTTTTTLPRTNGDGSSEPRPLQRFAVMEVFVDSDDRVVANVRVNGTVYKVGEGDRFANHYRVDSLSQADRCGWFFYGDDRFRACEGEELVK